MINKKLLASVLLAAIATTGISYTFASDSSSTGTTSTQKEFRQFSKMGNKGFHLGKGEGSGGIHTELTTEEKTALEGMTDLQKKTFFDTKMQAEKVKMDAYENVIDKLLAGTSLTSQEEAIRQEIIKQRADRKVKMEVRKTEMDAMKVILDKKEAGQTLTADEKAKLDSFKGEKHNLRKHK